MRIHFSPRHEVRMSSDIKAVLEKKKARLLALREARRKKQEEESARATPVQQQQILLHDILGRSELNKYPYRRPACFELTYLPLSPRKVELKIVQVHEAHILPKEHFLYDKGTQTKSTEEPNEILASGIADEGEKDFPEVSHAPIFPSELQLAMPPSIEEKGSANNQKDTLKTSGELSEGEKQTIMTSEEFLGFFDRASRCIERVLDEESDLLFDISADLNGDVNREEKTGQRVILNRCFDDERWSRNRVVTSMDWCPQYPELLVASYNNNTANPNDPEGLALVWNTRFKKKIPEYIFHCESPVMSVSFAKFHPNLILGGTYSGQLVLWDNRVHKRTPVQKSLLSHVAHSRPIYSVTVVGTGQAPAVVSVSNDGRLCTWSLEMLATPQESLDLVYKGNDVPVSCLSFVHDDPNNFFLGSEDSSVYHACRHGNRDGIVEAFEGHQGLITGIDTHHAQGSADFSHLFLSSSFDWTIKLWSAKDEKPLHSFEDNGEYVYDVAWSPIHPAVFAAVDGNGRLDIWNLTLDIEFPTASVVGEKGVALNQVSWAQSGRHICVGDGNGRIWVYDLDETLALPKPDDWSKMSRTLQEMKMNRSDDMQISASLFSYPISSPVTSLRL
ncbi:unnamed protein product [Darwinula stevensoni]|uniref:Uncharacterized protein n=1 Tax=Darwinula stevensoni TaxID=69355 RepID=A0A7R8X6Z6_9CRUS|nr:unnamed protein product [Darwinula stevensoni]CAG0888154.1 unnamed protein product [Darwinula stevensoni]